MAGNRIGDIAHAVGRVCRTAGYGIPQGFGGHGVGRRMHEDPEVPNEGRPGCGLPLRPGMVLAIEPMLIAGGKDGYHEAADGWTLRTNDGSRAATSSTRWPSRSRVPGSSRHGPDGARGRIGMRLRRVGASNRQPPAAAHRTGAPAPVGEHAHPNGSCHRGHEQPTPGLPAAPHVVSEGTTP